MQSWRRVLLEKLWAVVPGEKFLLRSMSAAPSFLKGTLLQRIGTPGLHRARNRGDSELIARIPQSNAPPVYLPVSSSADYFFGRPAEAFEEENTLLVARILAPHSTWLVDVGAHLGLFIWFAHEQLSRGLRLCYFEPQLNLFESLQRNLIRLGYSDAIACNAVATDIDGVVEFHLDHTDWSMATVAGNPVAADHVTSLTKVTSMRLDTVMSLHSMSDVLLKLDVEGGESLAIRGVSGNVSALKYCIIEVLPGPETIERVRSMMQTLNMEARRIDGRKLVPFATATESSSEKPGKNWLFIRSNCNFGWPELAAYLDASSGKL